MDIQKLTTLIKSTQSETGKKGKLFTVKFFKRDGSIRTMKARLGLQRNLTGKGLSFDPATKALMPVWSADSQGYRMVNLATVFELKIGKETYYPKHD